MSIGIRRAAVAVLVALPALVVVPLATPAHAAAGLAVSKAAPGTVLAGAPIPYTLTASNPGDQPSYNLTFRDVLPLGVTYRGPTTPTEAGEPQVVTNLVEVPVGSGQLVAQQTLIWANVADIQAGDAFSLSFGVVTNNDPDPAQPTKPVFSVGSTVTNVGEAYSSSDARVVPAFDPQGNPVANPLVDADTSGPVSTRLSAIQVDKSEPSPEGELLRGVHDFTTTYSLRVRVSPEAGVNSVVLTDLLPAALEFLGCGDVDNSSTEEYPGSGPLGTGPPIAGCPTPAAVATVVDPPADGTTTYPPGTYTAVRWDLGNLPAGADVTVRYVAGVPLNANTPFPAPAPTPESLRQAANLDNNTGPSTRERIPEASVTNVARVEGTYLGPLAPGATPDVADDDRLTRSVEDLRIRKSVDPEEFTAGGKARYRVQVDTSEYVSASGVVLTDRIPNGVCPLAPGENFSADGALVCEGAVGDQATVAVAGGSPTPVAFASVTEDAAAGGYEVVFAPLPPVPAASSATVDYVGGMRATYELGPNDGASTVAGDTFVNRVAATATTTPIPASPETGEVTVADTSEAEQVTGGLTIDKELLPRGRLDPGAPCPETGYEEVTDPADPRFRYRLGDRVCFRLRVDFPDRTFTRDAVVADFLPVGVEYDPGSMQATAANVLAPFAFDEAAAAAGTLPPVWLVGTPTATGRFTQPGAVFEVVLAGRVVDIPDKDTPLITGNLMKMRTRNTEGRARSYRDQVPFSIAPAPVVELVKGVQSVDSPPFASTGPDVDGVTVQEGSLVTFRVDLTNGGTIAGGNDYSVRGFDVWDVLPPNVTCSSISNITDFTDDSGSGPVRGTCTGPNDAGHPDFLGADTRSAIRWVLVSDPSDPAGGVDRWTIRPGATRTLTYQMTVPTPTAAGTRLVDTASVRSFEAFTNEQNGTATYYPADNVDQGVSPDQENAPAATDPSFVVTPGPVVEKSAVTSVVESNNNLTTQAVPGEVVTYTYGVRIPANTSVFEGILRDGITTNANRVTLLGADWSFVPDASTGDTGTRPGGFTLSPTGVLTFPDLWTNDTATQQEFRVTLTFRVRNDFAQNNQTVTNTASFLSVDQPGGQPIDTPDASWAVTILQPSPQLTKSASPSTVTAGDTVRFQLNARNASGRPPLHDTWLEDCIPDGLTFAGLAAVYPNVIGPEAGNATNGCDPTETYLAFGLGTLNGGVTVARAYDVTVDPPAVGGTTYRNRAELTGSSLADGKDLPTDPDNPLERTYRAPAATQVVVPGAGISKTVTPTRATIGETVTYTVRASIPANTSFYQAALRDKVPPGLDPASITITDTECLLLTSPAIPCALTPTLLPVVPDPAVPGGSLAAFLVGDIPSSPVLRSVTISYTARMADVASSTAGSAVRNTAQTVWMDQPGSPEPTLPTYPWNTVGPTASATVTVLEPDLTVTKGVSDTTPEPGDLFTYTVTVTNRGPDASDAYALVVEDLVPAGVEIIDGTISNDGEYDPDTRLVTWDAADLPGPLAPGESLELTYVAELAPSSELASGVRLTNTVTIRSYTSFPTDGRTYGPEAPATATVAPAFPRLRTVKTAVDGEPTYLDTPYTWQVAVTNVGDGRAYGVSILDLLPEGWAYDAGSAVVSFPDGSTESREPILPLPLPVPQELRWPGLGQLAPGETVTLRFRARATPGTVADPGIGSAVRQTNTVSTVAFDATGADGNRAPDGSVAPYGNDDVTASTRIDAVDLRVQKLPAASPPVAGSAYSWRVRVSNLSTTDTAAGPFTVVDTLPDTPGVRFVSASGAGWTCQPPTATTVACTRTPATATLAAGASFPDLLVTFDLDPAIPAQTAIANRAEVRGRTYDVDLANNEATSTVAVTTSADLQIVKRHTGTAVAGRPLTYTLAVSNNGPSVSRIPITVRDTLPAGVSFTSVTAPAPWSCSHDGSAAGGAVTCTAATDLAVGPAPGIAIDVVVLSGTTAALVNQATITGTTPDPNGANNTSTDTVVPGTSADLFIDKVSTTPLLAGSTGTYRLRVGNNGPSDAASVRVTDSLPPGLTFAGSRSVSGTWTCAATGPTAVAFTCDLTGTLVSQTDATVDVDVAVARDVTGAVVNEAVVASATPDPIPGNNRDSDRTDAVAEADLTITKRGPDEVVAGEAVTWTLVVENLGPSDSPGPIAVEDRLPDGVAFVSAGGSGWTCDHDGSPSGGLVRCTTAGPLPAAPSADRFAPAITIAGTVLPSAGPATVVNAAVVDGPVDPNPDNDDATHSVRVVDEVDLLLEKSVDPVAIVAGREVTYTLRVTNLGPSDADTSLVVDRLPAGMTALSATSTSWTCPAAAGSRIVCTRDGIPAGESSTITVVALVDSSVPAGSVLTNDAEVSTVTTERDPSNNTASVGLPVSAEADLYLLKTHPAGAVAAGDDVVFTLTAGNRGPSDAVADVVIVDQLPPGLTYVSADGPWTCQPASVDPAGQEVTCTLDGALVAGTSRVLAMRVATDPTADPGGYVNTATVTSPTGDPGGPGDNTATDQVDLVTSADLSITKAHDPAAVRVGGELDFTLTVRNAGPSEARGVVVTDTLPAGLTLRSAAGAGWTCTVSAPSLSCDLDAPLAPGAVAEPVTVTASVEAGAYPQVVNVADVTASTPDPDRSDNRATDTVAVPALVDLTVAKSHAGPVQVGGTITYTVVVTNLGPTADPGPIAVSDPLPASLAPVSAGGPGVSCSISGQSVQCSVAGPLAAGATATLTVVAGVLPAAFPSVSNTVTVSTPSEQTDTTNDRATDVATVTPDVRLQVVKSRSVLAGRQATWTIEVSNVGRNATVDPVVMTDDLPDGLGFVSVGGQGWSCTGTRQVVCTYGATIAAGAAAPVVVLVTDVTAPPGTVVRNVAVVSGGSPGTPTVQDDAQVVVSVLPPTGGSLGGVPLALALLALGGALVLVSRRRR